VFQKTLTTHKVAFLQSTKNTLELVLSSRHELLGNLKHLKIETFEKVLSRGIPDDGDGKRSKRA
jgi:hypothetical protein